MFVDLTKSLLLDANNRDESMKERFKDFFYAAACLSILLRDLTDLRLGRKYCESLVDIIEYLRDELVDKFWFRIPQ
jgi:hypothetical protein